MNKEFAKQYEHPKWQKKRLEVFKRDKYKCQYCGDIETQLHIHHFEYEKDKKVWETNNDLLITVCKHCHRILEYYKKNNIIKLKKYEYPDKNKLFIIQTIDEKNILDFIKLDIENNSVNKFLGIPISLLNILYKYFK